MDEDLAAAIASARGDYASYLAEAERGMGSHHLQMAGGEESYAAKASKARGPSLDLGSTSATSAAGDEEEDDEDEGSEDADGGGGGQRLLNGGGGGGGDEEGDGLLHFKASPSAGPSASAVALNHQQEFVGRFPRAGALALEVGALYATPEALGSGLSMAQLEVLRDVLLEQVRSVEAAMIEQARAQERWRSEERLRAERELLRRQQQMQQQLQQQQAMHLAYTAGGGGGGGVGSGSGSGGLSGGSPPMGGSLAGPFYQQLHIPASNGGGPSPLLPGLSSSSSSSMGSGSGGGGGGGGGGARPLHQPQRRHPHLGF
jgi:hypothetical protein